MSERRILAGMRVVEIAGIGPGPFCGMHLADLGADVIAVERPEAATRLVPTRRGKRSVNVDLKSQEGRDVVLSLVETADALIEGMRPGVMERLGLGPADCAARNSRLVYARITGWGQTGPLAQGAGHDNNFAALAGALYFSGPSECPPVAPLSLLGDVAGGALYLAIGVLAGVLGARTSGKGTVVDAAMVDGCAHMLQLLLMSQRTGMVADHRGGASMQEASPFFAAYLCADGEYVTIAAIEPAFYLELLQQLDIAGDPLFAHQWDRARWPEMKTRLAAVFLRHTRAEWSERLEGSDACFAPVLAPQDAHLHPHHQARGTFFTSQDLLQPAAAPRFDGHVVHPGPIPAAGADTQRVLDALNDPSGLGPWHPTAAAYSQPERTASWNLKSPISK